MLKKADKTWVAHQIHEFLDDEYQLNKIRTDLCSRMYCKHALVGSRRLDGENSHQSPVYIQMTHVFTSQKGNHRGSEILERFLNAEVV